MPSNTPEYSKLHYQHNKRMTSLCDCGCVVSKPNLKNHLTTQRHLDFINNGVVVVIQPPLTDEDEILVDCIQCGCLGIVKAKMDLHLISTKCKKTTELIKTIQRVDIDELDRDIQNMLLRNMPEKCQIVNKEDVILSYTKYLNDDTQINTENWVYNDGSTGKKMSYLLEERQIFTRTFKDGLKQVAEYRKCNQWEPTFYVINP